MTSIPLSEEFATPYVRALSAMLLLAAILSTIFVLLAHESPSGSIAWRRSYGIGAAYVVAVVLVMPAFIHWMQVGNWRWSW